ncbi:uncharacterized protein LOC122505738 [Leptopilina heterotoma]|uniref:uncharacterized protein LOC122505738 n=1 Tax=Leptopilina heterotoma TaxID=63436 RepID=UPI001CA90BE2|nr:uncharacterized protein LOC122505738 [Leptopilina heterotoma]
MDRNLIIIHCVEDHPCLYDKHNPKHKDNVKKMQAWENIAKCYAGISGEREHVDVLKSRWKSLKNIFTTEYQETNKYTKSGSAAVKGKVPWEYYEAMLFLKPHISHLRFVCII